MAVGSDVQAYDAGLTAIAALAMTDSNFLVGNGSTWVLENASTARTSIGAQASDTELSEIAALANTNNNFIVGTGTVWALETPANVRTSLGLVIGTNVQAFDTELDEIAALANTDSNFIVGTGSVWTVESTVTAQASLGVQLKVKGENEAVAGITLQDDVDLIGFTLVAGKHYAIEGHWMVTESTTGDFDYAWVFTNTGRTSLLDGTFDIDSDTFKIALFLSTSDLGAAST
ncbi:hypothetical protein LCGC14_1397960, partial [marine sediment metagenome]